MYYRSSNKTGSMSIADSEIFCRLLGGGLTSSLSVLSTDCKTLASLVLSLSAKAEEEEEDCRCPCCWLSLLISSFRCLAAAAILICSILSQTVASKSFPTILEEDDIAKDDDNCDGRFPDDEVRAANIKFAGTPLSSDSRRRSRNTAYF